VAWRSLSRPLDSSTYDAGPSFNPNFYRVQSTTNRRTTETRNTNLDKSKIPFLNTLVEHSQPVPHSVQDLNSNTPVITAALKEWAVVCKALEDGRQVLLLRKGGILEYRQGFQVRHSNFFLYPTFEHQSSESIQADFIEKFEMIMHEQPSKGKNIITSYARAVTVKQITDVSLLPSLQKYHIWNDSYVNLRMNYNPKKPISVVLLRVYRIDPIEVDVKSEWLGCKSWIPIESIPSQSQSKNHLDEQNNANPEHWSSHGNYFNNIRSNEHPVIEDLRFERIVDELEEILK
jgi:hypothetical protein